MSGKALWRLSTAALVGAAGVTTLGCGGGNRTVNPQAEVIDLQARADLKKINDYFGTSPGGASKKPLLPTLDDNFNYLRTVIKQMQCDIETLQNGGVKPTPCPKGGPSESPTTTPKYPA